MLQRGNGQAIDPLAQWRELHQGFCSMRDELHELRKLVQEIAETQKRKDPVQTNVVLGVNPVRLTTQGYRHARILVGGAATIVIDVAGLSVSAVYTTAGWYPLDYGDGAMLTAASPVTVRLELTDEAVI